MMKQENISSKEKKTMKQFSFYKPYELAKKLKVSEQTIYRWIREGKIAKPDVRKVKIEKEITIIKFPS